MDQLRDGYVRENPGALRGVHQAACVMLTASGADARPHALHAQTPAPIPQSPPLTSPSGWSSRSAAGPRCVSKAPYQYPLPSPGAAGPHSSSHVCPPWLQVDPDISYRVQLQVAKEDFVTSAPAALAVPAGAVFFNVTVFWPTLGSYYRRHPDALIEENRAWWSRSLCALLDGVVSAAGGDVCLPCTASPVLLLGRHYGSVPAGVYSSQ